MFSNRCGHQNGAFSWSELAQGLLSVSLGAVAMDTGAGVALAVQEVLQGVGTFLGLHKHQSQRVLAWRTEREDGWCQLLKDGPLRALQLMHRRRFLVLVHARLLLASPLPLILATLPRSQCGLCTVKTRQVPVIRLLSLSQCTSKHGDESIDQSMSRAQAP